MGLPSNKKLFPAKHRGKKRRRRGRQKEPGYRLKKIAWKTLVGEMSNVVSNKDACKAKNKSPGSVLMGRVTFIVSFRRSRGEKGVAHWGGLGKIMGGEEGGGGKGRYKNLP